MLIDEPCYVREAKYVESLVTNRDPEADFKRKEMEAIIGFTELTGDPRVPLAKRDQAAEKSEEVKTYNEGGIYLLLWSPRMQKEYKRFLPASSVKEFLISNGLVNCPDLEEKDLRFFAEQWSNRKHPLNITIFDNDMDSVMYETHQNLQGIEEKRPQKLIGIKKGKRK
jgi:hypothetical protein